MEQLGKLRDLLDPNERAQVEVLAITPDSQDKLKDTLEKVGIKSADSVGFRLLSDKDHAVIDRYGLRNEAAAAKGRFIPHPTTYVLDRKGRVVWKFTEVDYKVRPTNEDIRAALKKVK